MLIATIACAVVLLTFSIMHDWIRANTDRVIERTETRPHGLWRIVRRRKHTHPVAYVLTVLASLSLWIGGAILFVSVAGAVAGGDSHCMSQIHAWASAALIASLCWFCYVAGIEAGKQSRD